MSHQFYDKDSNLIGSFSLNIIPPLTGSTVVKVQSTGNVVTSSESREIQSTLAIPSLAQFAVVANDNMRFGQGTTVYGPIQSNYGIHFDGVAHNLVSSALSSYVDPDTGYTQFGVYTAVIPPPGSGTYSGSIPAEAPPSTPAARSDVFMAGRQFPVTTFDFTGMTTDLASMKATAQASTSNSYFASSGSYGYNIILKTNGTYDLYKVTQLQTPTNSCTTYSDPSPATVGWGSWSVKTQQFLKNYTFPSSGVIFIEDNVWVEGQINHARLTIASGKFPDNPSTRTSITVNNNLLYTNFDGTDSLSLVSQNNVNVGMYGLDTLTIDGALVAQNGRVGRFYYATQCSPYATRTNLTLYGMIATNTRYGFAYSDGTGYTNRYLNYDGNMLYAPPPDFPLTSSLYSVIGWQSIK